MNELNDQWLGLAYNLPVYIAFACCVLAIGACYLMAAWILRQLAYAYVRRAERRIKRAKAEHAARVRIAEDQLEQRKHLKHWFLQILQQVQHRVSKLTEYRRAAYKQGFARVKTKADWAEFEAGFGNWCKLETRVRALRSECAGTFITPQRIAVVSGLWFAIHPYANWGTPNGRGAIDLDVDDYQPWRTDRVERYIKDHLRDK